MNLGGVGQPLSLFLKCSPLVDSLALYDIANSPGVAGDLSHINTQCKVAGYLPQNDGLNLALKEADILFITAGNVVQKVVGHDIYLNLILIARHDPRRSLPTHPC